MKRVIESATPLWKDDINYPGVPPMPDRPLAAKITNRATVDYETYVLAYTTRKVLYVMLTAFGMAASVLTVVTLTGAAMVILAALSIGAALAGIVGVMVITEAHRSYTRHLAIAVTETYHDRPATPPPNTVRPYVASSNGDGRTTNTGRLNFTPAVWQALFNRALANGGYIDRDNVCKPAGVGRRWYHSDPNSPDGFRAFLAELRQIQFIDDRNRLTDTALSWYAAQINRPLDALPLSPTGQNTPVNPRSVAGRSVNTRSHGDSAAGQGGS